MRKGVLCLGYIQLCVLDFEVLIEYYVELLGLYEIDCDE